MKKIILFTAAACLAIGFTACKKDKTTTDSKTLLVGKWKSSFTAVDSNSNNAIDANEKATDTSSTDYVTYYSNGSAIDSSVTSGSYVVYPATWSLSSDNQYIVFNVLGFTEGGKITQLDGSNLVIQDTSASPASWTGYVHY